MSWWSSVVDGAKTLGTGLGTGIGTVVNWSVNTGYVGRVATTALNYTVNSTIQALNQVLVLPRATKALFNKPESKKILNGMYIVAKNDVLPLVGVNFVNTAVQTYFRQGIESTPELSTAYTVFLGGLTVVDYGVRAYTWRQGVQTLIHGTTLDVLGPSAFNKESTRPRSLAPANKDAPKDPVWQGKLREPFILAGNDLLAWGLGKIPYVGWYLAKGTRISSNGRYIARLSTSNLSEENKLPLMMQEAIIALGFTYEMSSMLMDMILERTVGMPPYLYYRTIQHLLLLLHVNVAAHMAIPRVKEEDLTLPYDPFSIYERVSRFVFDVQVAGLEKRVPMDIKFDPNAEPLISLNSVLRLGTQILNSDLEIEGAPAPSKFYKIMSSASDWVLPPILRGTKGVINDPILKMYWPAVQEGATENLKLVRTYGNGRTTAVLAWSPAGVAKAVYYIFGVPEVITISLLKLTREEDVWDFIEALEAWFVRHGVKKEVILKQDTSANVTPLNGVKAIEPVPAEPQTPLRPASELISTRKLSSPVISDPSALITKREEKPLLPPESLIPNRIELRVASNKDSPQTGTSPTKGFGVFDPSALQTTRRRNVAAETSTYGM